VRVVFTFADGPGPLGNIAEIEVLPPE
jgi:hypothetical protein